MELNDYSSKKYRNLVYESILKYHKNSKAIKVEYDNISKFTKLKQQLTGQPKTNTKITELNNEKENENMNNNKDKLQTNPTRNVKFPNRNEDQDLPSLPSYTNQPEIPKGSASVDTYAASQSKCIQVFSSTIVQKLSLWSIPGIYLNMENNTGHISLKNGV